MLDALYIGASGMHAQQMNMDVTANNLANVNTPGFKKSSVTFEDLMYRGVGPAGEIFATDNGMRLGSGTAIANTDKVFSAGDLKPSDSPYDLAIRGQGFFEVVMPDGSMGYTRDGALKVNQDGMLSTISGHPLSDLIQVPPDARQLIVQEDGQVLVKVPNQTDLVPVGQINLANFVNPGGLEPVGNNLYAANDKSGDSLKGAPGTGSYGAIAQNYTEASNVKLIEEMVNLVMAQRAYEINSKVVQASDDMLRISNSLYR